MSTTRHDEHCLSMQDMRDYATGNLPLAEQQRVDRHLSTCQLCAAAVAAYAQLADEDGLAEDMTAMASQINNMTYTSNTPRRIGFNEVAASLLLLLGCFAAWQYWAHTAPERLFASHFAPPQGEAALALRSEAAAPLSEAAAEGLAAWEGGRFAESIPHFERQLEQAPDNDEAAFYLAVAYLSEGQAADAIDLLQKLRLQSAPHRESATWYLAMAHTKAGDTAAAQELLTVLLEESSEGSRYAKKAESLLSRLSE